MNDFDPTIATPRIITKTYDALEHSYCPHEGMVGFVQETSRFYMFLTIDGISDWREISDDTPINS